MNNIALPRGRYEVNHKKLVILISLVTPMRIHAEHWNNIIVVDKYVKSRMQHVDKSLPQGQTQQPEDVAFSLLPVLA